MPKTYSSIWLHAVWTTRHREPVLNKSFRYKLFHHIKQYGVEQGLLIDVVNGTEDHIHCLFRLKPNQSPSDIIRRIKGESSHWINKSGFIDNKFHWQEGYGIFSISEKDIGNVRAYIYNQEKHHHTMSYREEVQKLTGIHDA